MIWYCLNLVANLYCIETFFPVFSLVSILLSSHLAIVDNFISLHTQTCSRHLDQDVTPHPRPNVDIFWWPEIDWPSLVEPGCCWLSIFAGLIGQPPLFLISRLNVNICFYCSSLCESNHLWKWCHAGIHHELVDMPSSISLRIIMTLAESKLNSYPYRFHYYYTFYLVLWLWNEGK